MSVAEPLGAPTSRRLCSLSVRDKEFIPRGKWMKNKKLFANIGSRKQINFMCLKQIFGDSKRALSCIRIGWLEEKSDKTQKTLLLHVNEIANAALEFCFRAILLLLLLVLFPTYGQRNILRESPRRDRKHISSLMLRDISSVRIC